MLSCLCALVPAFAPSSDWKLVSKGMAKSTLGISAMNSSTVFLAGNGGTIANGPFVAVSTDSGQSWAAIQGVSESNMMLCNVVKVSSSGLRVAGGVTLVKEAIARSAAGADLMGSSFAAASDKDTFATQNIEAAHGSIFLTGEWNHNADGSKCSTPASPQCSGVAVADESAFPAASFAHIDWHGTDEPGVDARYGAFPSPTTWYVAGGMWPSAAAAAHALGHIERPKARRTVNRRDGPLDQYRALITKTTDGGKSWTTVFNDTGFNSSFAFYHAGATRHDGVSCVLENVDISRSSKIRGVKEFSDSSVIATRFRAPTRTPAGQRPSAQRPSAPTRALRTARSFTTPTTAVSPGRSSTSPTRCRC